METTLGVSNTGNLIQGIGCKDAGSVGIAKGEASGAEGVKEKAQLSTLGLKPLSPHLLLCCLSVLDMPKGCCLDQAGTAEMMLPWPGLLMSGSPPLLQLQQPPHSQSQSKTPLSAAFGFPSGPST